MYIFSVLASVVSIYTLLCFVRVMLSWFPGAEYSKFGRVLCQMCDPYLDIFRRFRFLPVSMSESSSQAHILKITRSCTASSMNTSQGTTLRYPVMLSSSPSRTTGKPQTRHATSLNFPYPCVLWNNKCSTVKTAPENRTPFFNM